MSIKVSAKNLGIMQIEKESIGNSTSPEARRCYCDHEGRVLFIMRVSSDYMDYSYVSANGNIGKTKTTLYRDTSYRSPSKGYVHGGQYKQCYVCKQKISYCVRIEQQQDTLQQIYENFKVLSPN